MDCIVKNFKKVNRDETGQLPYYILKAVGTQGDAEANAVDDDGFINPMAMQSRVFNFTKTLFPGTEKQCTDLEAFYEVDEEGNVTDGAKVRLMLYQWNTGVKFNIARADGTFYTEQVVEEVEHVADKTMNVNGKVIQKGQKYTTKETTERPKVYESVSLVLFCDKEEKCVEGDPEAIAKRNFETGIRNNIYFPIED